MLDHGLASSFPDVPAIEGNVGGQPPTILRVQSAGSNRFVSPLVGGSDLLVIDSVVEVTSKSDSRDPRAQEEHVLNCFRKCRTDVAKGSLLFSYSASSQSLLGSFAKPST